MNADEHRKNCKGPAALLHPAATSKIEEFTPFCSRLVTFVRSHSNPKLLRALRVSVVNHDCRQGGVAMHHAERTAKMKRCSSPDSPGSRRAGEVTKNTKVCRWSQSMEDVGGIQ